MCACGVDDDLNADIWLYASMLVCLRVDLMVIG